MSKPVTDEQILADLQAARRRIEGPGRWGQGWLGHIDQDDGAVCALGALLYATGIKHPYRALANPFRGQRWKRYKATRQRIAASSPSELRDGIGYTNDRRGTEHRDVKRWFDRAIADTRARIERAQFESATRGIVVTLDELKPCPVIEREPVTV